MHGFMSPAAVTILATRSSLFSTNLPSTRGGLSGIFQTGGSAKIVQWHGIQDIHTPELILVRHGD